MVNSAAVTHFLKHGKGVCIICLEKVDGDNGKMLDNRLICKRHEVTDLTKQSEKA